MKAYDYYQKYQRMTQGSLIATRKATAEDIKQVTGSDAIDWHAERKTEQE
jgi:hypothetical protein